MSYNNLTIHTWKHLQNTKIKHFTFYHETVITWAKEWTDPKLW